MSDHPIGSRCEDCGRYLPEKTVQQNSRSAPPEHWGLRYFICKNRNSRAPTLYCDYFYWIDPPPWSPPTASQSRNSGIMPGPRSSCVVEPCGSRGNKTCEKLMCKTHCSLGGGCRIHPAQVSPNGGSSVAATPPASSPPLPAQVPPSTSALSYLTVPQAQASSPPPPPPQISIISSTPPTASTSRLPSLPTQPIASTSTLPQTSSAAASPVPSLAPSTPRFPSAIPPPATPVTRRILPASIPRLSPRKASHIIDSFDAIYDAEQEAMRQKKLAHEEKLEMQQAERNAVTVHCWLKDDVNPTHDRFHSTGVPPRFKFTRSRLQVLGLAGDVSASPTRTRFRMYSPKDGYWLGAGEDDSFPTTPGQHLFVVGTAVQDFTNIDAFIMSIIKKPAAATEPHMRKNLAKDRESVRAQDRAAVLSSVAPKPKPRPIAPHPSLGPGTSNLKRSRSPSVGALLGTTGLGTGSSSAVKKHKYTHRAAEDVIELPGSSGDEQPMVLPQGMHGAVFSLVSDDSSESTSGNNDNESRESSPMPEFPFNEFSVPKTRRWPSAYWCIELDAGFSRINALTAKDQACGRKANTQAAFADAFPKSRFVAATFSENKSRWMNASVAERTRALEAGKTKDGKWEVFAQRNPDLKGKVRSERKKEKKRAIGSSSGGDDAD